ncbi:unnamed protein product [Rotaria sp. Silwood1]|nr:unnamed protein product [Rotaria sp. Silwood1]
MTLPNVGREGATFLSHIIENYDTLANHTLFSQAGVEGITGTGLENWFMSRLVKQFNASVGFMPLVVTNMVATYNCGNGPYGDFLRLTELWGILQSTLCPPGGQAANASHWIHKDSNHGWLVSTPENPIFGHVVERLWTVLFNCSNPDLVQKCQQENCACFD